VVITIDLYPGSSNVWDSMAEALMYAGDYKKAIAYYEKSIAINPKNENGKEMIKKMKETKN
jgi:tetratricopeptide (TPR) repeat protein